MREPEFGPYVNTNNENTWLRYIANGTIDYTYRPMCPQPKTFTVNNFSGTLILRILIIISVGLTIGVLTNNVWDILGPKSGKFYHHLDYHLSNRIAISYIADMK